MATLTDWYNLINNLLTGTKLLLDTRDDYQTEEDFDQALYCNTLETLTQAGQDTAYVSLSSASGTIAFGSCTVVSGGIATPLCGAIGIGTTGTTYLILQNNDAQWEDEGAIENWCNSTFDALKDKTSNEINETTVADSDFYKVQSGDTVWDIAEKYGLTVQDIIDANEWLDTEGRISDDQSFILIKPGEKLVIPTEWSPNREWMDTLGNDQAYIDFMKNNFNTAISTLAPTIENPRHDPLILDLDGDGLKTTALADGVYFDHDVNGFAETTAWVGADDGLLVIDLNKNKLVA